nr:MAG TPA: hypothetical protein [Caudoviricetes sp.]
MKMRIKLMKIFRNLEYTDVKNEKKNDENEKN